MKNWLKSLITLGLIYQFANAEAISVISREEGSGTRGAFIELFQVEKINKKGKKIDNTTKRAEITNSTSVVLSTIEGNKNAIGYISLGSLNDNIKPLKINQVLPNAENIKNKTYPIARPFNIAITKNTTKVAKDFINFILSKEGQKIIDSKGYISLDTTTNFQKTPIKGKITISGSSSITPIMEVLKEAYVALNPEVEIKIQQSDSTTGAISVLHGLSDIGMISRDLKESEKEKGLISEVIAMDGIVIIINKQNPINSLTKEQVKEIYTGNITDWDTLK
ncbi:substrate-binding domain-containing protein [Helicobacter anatolicus]|uniref:substrate-binding domain-containing protein n=1 Tax=Helicobacter anatolicus TaxID=2905874 RepID=UPI001E2A6C20|nr:substrate-binding domain-containing protein [Helicobacter anatolicus]MCE3037978.1 substrate-binding domain-containing protein [Helicobacter anatolicus]